MSPTEMIVGGDEIFRHRMTEAVFPFSKDGDLAMPLDTLVQVERIPVHHIRKMERGHSQDEYIAIEPRLREILEVPFLEKVRKAERVEAEWREHAHKSAQRVAKFNSQSWYVRVWRALRGNV
jgi:hypothetical protein